MVPTYADNVALNQIFVNVPFTEFYEHQCFRKRKSVAGRMVNWHSEHMTISSKQITGMVPKKV